MKKRAAGLVSLGSLALGCLLACTQASAADSTSSTVTMQFVQFVGQFASSDGQTLFIGSDGQVYPVSSQAAAQVNQDRVLEDLSPIPSVSAAQLSEDGTQSSQGAEPLNTVTEGGDCGSSTISILKANSTSANWYTSWSVTAAIGQPSYFSWLVNGVDPNGGTWNHNFGTRNYPNSSWMSATYNRSSGSGNYSLTIASNSSYVVGTDGICTSDGPTARVTV